MEKLVLMHSRHAFSNMVLCLTLENANTGKSLEEEVKFSSYRGCVFQGFQRKKLIRRREEDDSVHYLIDFVEKSI